MQTYSAVDEAVIHASVPVVFAALLDECAGRSHWWAPHVCITPVSDPPFDHVGATARSVVRSAGVAARFLWRIVAIEPNRLITIEYAEGDLVGAGSLILEPTPEGTRLRYDWQVRPTSLRARILAPILGMDRQHSKLMDRGFEGLEAYVTGK